MANMYFAICAFFISLLLIIIFFSKKKENKLDNALYSGLLITNFLDSIFMILVLLIGYGKIGNDNIAIWLNKFDFLQYIMWIWLFFIYVINITTPNDNKLKKLVLITGIINIFAVILVSASPLILYNENNVMYVYGTGVNYVYGTCAIYAILIILCMIFNIKKIISKKFLPIYILAIFMIVILFVNKYNPGLLIIPAVISYINLIMYFTIENPDLKMVKELELAKNTSEKANRAKSDFLSSMSHEIRTPLNAIVSLSEIIKNSEDINEIHEDANDVVTASQSLLEIVNGILDISKIEENKMEVINSNYNPVEIFNSLIKLAEARIEKKEIELRYSFDKKLPDCLYGDKGKLKQIISNILTNACKYTEKGYIDFNINCINEKDICKLEIIISDTGRGIKEAQMNTLFEKFNRLEEDRNTTIEGTGLGLAITKSLVEMMDGKIEVYSEYGKGTEFTIFLDQKIIDNKLNKFESETIKLDIKDKKVLIVDDNKLNIKVLNKMLIDFKLYIDSVLDGEECIYKIKNNNYYDIILMDIMMPKMDGVETLKKLKEIKEFNIPVVAVTADAMEGKKDKYIEAGFDDYLSKPINKRELERVLNKILNNSDYQLGDENQINVISDNKVIEITTEDIEILNKKMYN